MKVGLRSPLPSVLIAVCLLLVVPTVARAATSKPTPSPTPTPAPGPPSDAAVAFHIGAAHSGRQPPGSLAPGPVQKYTETCPWGGSCPLISPGKIFFLRGAALTAVQLAHRSHPFRGT